jgi:hypothetical protein
VNLNAGLIVLGHAAATSGLAWLYFRRYTLARPPIGVFTLADVAVLLVCVVLVPLLYLALPVALVAGLLALGALNAGYLAAEPIVRRRWLAWAIVLALGGAEIGLLLGDGPASMPFVVVRNALTILTAVTIANLWAQSGLRACDAAILGAALALYDAVATSWLPLMGDLIVRVAELPFAPLVAWPAGPDTAMLGIGLGDLLLLAVFPLVLRKAYGRLAGLVGLGLGLGGIVSVFVLASLGSIGLFPVMVVLGPLMVAQYAWWSRRGGRERTTWQYLQASSE